MYLAIFVVSTFFAWLSQSCIGNKLNKVFFFIAFIIPCFFVCFTNSGVDYVNYIDIIKMTTWDNYDSFLSLESGFNILILIIKCITKNNNDLTIFFIKMLSISLAFLSIYYLKKYILVYYSVLAYLLLLYLPSFYLIPMVLAVSMSLLAMGIYLKKNIILIPLIILVLAAQIHNSLYLIIPVFLWATKIKWIGCYSKLYKILSVIIFFISVCFSTTIYSVIQTNISGFHYNNYSVNNLSSSGIMLLIIYIPLCYIAFKLIIKNTHNILNTNNILYTYILASITFKILSYNFIVIERMELVMSVLYIVIIPYLLKKLVLNQFSSSKITLNKIYIYTIVYLIFRGIITYLERVTIASGLANYNFLNPFSM